MTKGNTGTTVTLTLPEATRRGLTFLIGPVYGISAIASDSTILSACGSHSTHHDICRSVGNNGFPVVPEGAQSVTFSYEIVGDTRDEVYLQQLVSGDWSGSVVRLVITDDDDTPTNTDAPPFRLTDTPVPTRSRLVYRRFDKHYTPRASTATPVVQCPAHRHGS